MIGILKNRIPEPLASRLEGNPFRRPNRYVSYNGHQVLSETTCKRCGAVLTALGVDPRVPARVRELKGTKTRTIIREVLSARLRTDLFNTIEFEVEEPVAGFVPVAGESRDEEPARLGLHRTSICTSCKQALLDGHADLKEVQQLYDADLERMAIEDEINKVSVESTRKTLAQLGTRKVVRIVE